MWIPKLGPMRPKWICLLPSWASGFALLPIVLGAMFLGISSSAGETSENQPKRVLVIASYGRDIAPWNAITPAFKRELARLIESPVEFYETGPATARAGESQPETVFVDYLRALYATEPPDLVVPVGAAATRFWWSQRESLFPSVPVVIGGAEQRMLGQLPLGPNDTAVTVEIDIARTGFDPIYELFPSTRNIALVIGDSGIERFWNDECQRSWASLGRRGQLRSFHELDFPEIRRQVASLPPDSVIAYWIFWVDAAGVPHEQMRSLEQICAEANAPVFGMFEEQLGHGIIGGRLISSESIGREAGRLAARVLNGEPAGRIAPVVLHPGPPMFDWRQLQRWNIDESKLPAGSVVSFRQPTAWQRNRWYILGAVGVITAQGATILGLLVHRARRRRAEATESVLAARLITAQEEERRSIARDLHDDLNQRLALLSVELDSASQADDPAMVMPMLDEFAQQVKDLSSEVHKLAYQLHPAKLDQLGLAAVARSLCSEFSVQSGLPIHFTERNMPRQMPEKLELVVFRVLQEALGNILRHSKATTAGVLLRVSRRHLHLMVSDNGCGFSLPGSGTLRGLGLLGMEERARLVGGRLRIRSSPGRGTRLHLTVPLKPDPATAVKTR